MSFHGLALKVLCKMSARSYFWLDACLQLQVLLSFRYVYLVNLKKKHQFSPPACFTNHVSETEMHIPQRFSNFNYMCILFWLNVL